MDSRAANQRSTTGSPGTRAARTPATLFAAIDVPVPVQQKRTPVSAAPLEWWAGGLVLAAYAALLMLLGHIFSWRRDVA